MNFETTGNKINYNLNFSKVFVGNFILVHGNGNTIKYTVWRIALILKSQKDIPNRTSNIFITSPRIEIYKRFNESIGFFRETKSCK